MNNTRKIISLAVAGILALSIAGCGRKTTGNKEADNALYSFNSIVKTYPDKKGFHKALQHWGFKLPTGEKFEWSKDTSANKADYAMVMLADSFIKAGLDVKKLNGEWLFQEAKRDEGEDLPNLLIKPYNINDKRQTSSGSEDALRRLFKADPNLVVYNNDAKLHSLVLGSGVEVQWTDKLGSGGADMVFILNAEPLVKAGLDPKKLEGWTYKPGSKDSKGNKVDQLVKTYKLK